MAHRSVPGWVNIRTCKSLELFLGQLPVKATTCRNGSLPINRKSKAVQVFGSYDTMGFAAFVLHPIVLSALAMSFIIAYRLLPTAGGTKVPWAKTSIPFLGGVMAYGEDPVSFLVEQRKKVGDVFRVNLLVIKMTFVIGSNVSTDWKAASTRMLTLV